MSKLEYKEKLIFAELLRVDLDEDAARSIAIAQVKECGSLAMSPADIDLYCEGHNLNFDEMMFVSDFLGDILKKESEPVASCSFCGEISTGSIFDVGMFLLAHREYHVHDVRIASMLEFSEDGVEFDDGDDGDELAEGD